MATALPEQEHAEHATSRRAERTALRYLAAFVCIGLALYVLPFVAERLPALQPYAASDWGGVLDQSYNLQNANADVVIFGDSSALYGVDTPRLSTEFGMKVINLPQSIGSLGVNGDLPLRKYLAGNRPPRIIVFYLAPWDRDFSTASDRYSYEGSEQIVRNGSAADLLHLLRTKPRLLGVFPLQFYLVHSSLTRIWNPGTAWPKPHNGFMPYPPSLPGPITGRCAIPQYLVNLTSDRSLRELLATYSGKGSEVVTVLAAVPQCTGVEQLMARFGSALTVLPHTYFANDTLLVHVRADHTDETTARVANILRGRLAEQQR
jgi:hypothetical protein